MGWSSNKYVPSDIYKRYLEIPVTEYLERVNGMDQIITLTFWRICPTNMMQPLIVWHLLIL